MTQIPEGYMADAKGRLVPESMVRPHEQLEDQTVRKIVRFARDLSAQIGRFKGHTFEDVHTFLDVLREEHGQTRRGAEGKGNITLTSYDGSLRVQVRVHDQLTFGPGLQVAKEGVDECLNEWAADAQPELRTVVQTAFKTDKEGQVSREAIFSLLRLEIADERWQRAMQALRDSIRVIGSKQYIRIQTRDEGGAWKALPIDIAAAEAPASPAGEGA